MIISDDMNKDRPYFSVHPVIRNELPGGFALEGCLEEGIASDTDTEDSMEIDFAAEDLTQQQEETPASRNLSLVFGNLDLQGIN